MQASQIGGGNLLDRLRAVLAGETRKNLDDARSNWGHIKRRRVLPGFRGIVFPVNT